METEDIITLPAASNSRSGNEENDLPDSGCEPNEVNSLPLNADVKEEGVKSEVAERTCRGGNETDEHMMSTGAEVDTTDKTDNAQVSFELTEPLALSENISHVNSMVHLENGFVTVQDESCLNNHVREHGSHIDGRTVNSSSLSGNKRPRLTFELEVQQPSVHVFYNSLPRDSKRKLEELLRQWSRWHAQCCTSLNDSSKVVESGEETYFPALQVGSEKSSAVTFWVDNQMKNQPDKEFMPLNDDSVPLYDRGCAFALTSDDGPGRAEGGMEIDASRCFNCGSYSHALKECPKPRDNTAVSNARKQHKSRRNQSANSRNSSRYYQSSPGGKYDGLRPGVLEVKTRQLLGLGELDPPPWLNRMREIGYPPGYLDPDDEDQPSGITIFADEVVKEETEEGEILDTSYRVEPSRKKSVKFPGINAPIPKNADERLWSAGFSIPNPSRDNSNRRFDHENLHIDHYREQRWSRDYEDEWPPGCEPGTSPSLAYHSRRYGGYDHNYSSPSPRAGPSIPRSPSFSRSMSDRRRRSPYRDDSSYGYYSSYAYTSPR